MTGKRKVWKRRVLAGAIFALGFTLVFLTETGWFSPMKPWQALSGWQEIPSRQLPGPEVILTRAGETPQIQWLGHSGFLIRWHDQTILLDPNLSGHCTVIHREARNLVEDLNPFEPDLALISHAHFDHFDIPTLRGIKTLKAVAGPAVLKSYLGEVAANGTRFSALKPMDSFALGPLKITAVRAVHGGNRFHPIHGGAVALGYMIADGETTLYFAGDTGRAMDFTGLGKAFSPDIAILPIGAFRPYWLLRPHHLSPEDAAAAGKQLGAKVVIPCHFGTFRMAFDPLNEALPRFAKAAEQAGLAWYVPVWGPFKNLQPGRERSTVANASFVN